jgi:hypothetical protein
MAATTGNAIKAHIEAELSLAMYRDTAPNGEPVPYGTVHDAITVTPDGREDGGIGNAGTETVQVDLWEPWRDVNGEVAESPFLADNVVKVLHGAQLETAPKRVYGVTVISRRRLLEPDASSPTYRGLVHTAITATVRRLL